MGESEQRPLEPRIKTSWIVALFVGISLVWAATPFIVIWLVGRSDAGLFGDTFGSINALFSGLAFAGVVCAILLQRLELRLQREELTLTRAELKRTAAAQEESGAKLAEQAEVMKVTAHLNGLSTLIQAISSQIEYLKSTNDPPNRHIGEEIDKQLKSRKMAIEELESLMHAIRSAAEYPYR